jgi:enolase-phosphatase E1
MIAAIVIDIEGTTSPTSSVREKLYDYTRQHLGQWLADNHGGAADSPKRRYWPGNPTPARRK